MPDFRSIVSALIEIAENEANPDEIQLRAWFAIMRFIDFPLQVPDARTTRQLDALLRLLLRKLDAITPEQAPARRLPTPGKWLN